MTYFVWITMKHKAYEESNGVFRVPEQSKCWIGPQKRNKQTKGQRKYAMLSLELAWTESAI